MRRRRTSVSNLYSGQAFNPYSYVGGNPLTLVDPSCFQANEPGVMVFPDAHITASYEAQLARYINHQRPPPREPPPPKETEDARQAGEVGAAAPPTDVDTTGSSPEIDAQAATTAAEEGLEGSTEVRGGLGFAYGAGQSWLPGGFLVPSAQPKDRVFEFWRGAGQFSAGVVEVVAGAGLIGGGGAAAAGGVAGAAPTGGTSLLLTAVGVSGATAGWVIVGQGVTGIVAGVATIADSMSLSTGSGSGSTGPQVPPTPKAGAESVKEALSGLRSGQSSRVKVVKSAEELKDLFGRLSAGGEPIQGTTYPGGQFVKLPDGTSIGLRESSKSGGPAIDIRLPNSTRYKVHIE